MDTARYGLEPPPPSRRNDFNAWRAALDNAYAQLEHQHNRRVASGLPRDRGQGRTAPLGANVSACGSPALQPAQPEP